MERSNRDLETLVASQKEQLIRYEKRLKDVVTAYKGLLKEKEALETSFAAFTSSKKQQKGSNNETNEAAVVTVNESTLSPAKTEAVRKYDDEDGNNLQTQIITLMNSLATLSAEKSRMEASFQADKKQLRAQLTQKDQILVDLNVKIKENEVRAKADVDEVKVKWIVERQEREKETNNQMLMIRELQKLYADERHLKENIEMQLNNFKTQFASNEAENSRMSELQAQLKEAKAHLKQFQAVNSKHRGNGVDELAENAAILKQVQQEMHQLKEQHAVAIKNEQRRVLLAEEQSKHQAALHENRVANLESRLAELSSTVGSYDRLRQQDQESIHTLKRQLHELERNSEERTVGSHEHREYKKSISMTHNDLAAIVDEIVRLKKLLMSENLRTTSPIDVSQVLTVGTDHAHCQDEVNRIQQQNELDKIELAQLQAKMQIEKSHIATLQDKVKVLNRNIDEQEFELKQQTEKLRTAVKEERSKWKASLTEMEIECRCKVNDLEQQLQKQRQRSLQLLEEKEQELKTLQTSFEVFHNVTMPATAAAHNISADVNAAISDVESIDGATVAEHQRVAIKSKKMSVGENCHMLHYANEIARKDIEIAGLRKSKYSAETSLRKAIQEKVTAQQELCEKIDALEEQVDRLERCKTREGANLEYLKNVIISFIVTRDAEGKRHMLNAISAVLQFTPTEVQSINATFQK